MKNFYLLLIGTVLLPVTLLGQLTKGTWLLGGSGRLDVPTIITHDEAFRSDDTYYEFSLAPTLGYFISNRFMIGARFITYARLREGNGLKADFVNFFPQVRYYFNPAHEKRNWFALVESNFDQIRLGAGVNYFLAPGVALEGFAGARWDGSNSVNLLTNLGLQFFLNQNRGESASIAPQLGRGTWLLGGTAEVNSQEGENFRFLLFPNVGYFLSDRWVLGGRLSASHFRSDNFDVRVSTLGFSPFLRYYLNPAGGRTRWFLMADAGVERGVAKGDEQYAIDGDYNRFATSGRGGLNYFLSPNVALEGTFGVFYSTLESNSTQSATSTSNIFRLGADFGIQFFLNKK
ncbi:MAG: hypothetical protein ACK4TA_23965 [Saprospiraceae bacterium]